MSRVFIVAVMVSFLFGCAIAQRGAVETVDVNNDGKPDIKYYSDGQYVSKAELDTNYDGKTDVVMNLKDGKFQSAEADTDYNGTMDKKFDNLAAFNAWLNKDNPEFFKKMSRNDWAFGYMEI
jgi:hypothetical protein